MRNADKVFALLIGLAAIAGCQKSATGENAAAPRNSAAPVDIEALPPDESSATPSNELANGADNADVADLNASGNGY
jgi:hypothetical protein